MPNFPQAPFVLALVLLSLGGVFAIKLPKRKGVMAANTSTDSSSINPSTNSNEDRRPILVALPARPPHPVPVTVSPAVLLCIYHELHYN
jgi:hypothetical protein